MVKILLICSAGMSTSLLVNKMIKAAEAKGLEDITIEAHPEAEVTSAGADADVILYFLGRNHSFNVLLL